MEREAIAYMFAVPTMLNVLNQEPTARRRDWSKLKCLLIAAVPGRARAGRGEGEVSGRRLSR